MFRHRPLHIITHRTYFDWFLLSFLGGTINTGGFMAAHRFVSHVTGFFTLFGIGAAAGSWDQAIGILSVPSYFLMGAMISALLVDRRITQGEHPRYAWVMSLVCLCLLVACLGGHFHFFGKFGNDPVLKQDYVLLALLCMASGLQNAAISTASRDRVRTTHMTGYITDLGRGLVRRLSKPADVEAERKANYLRMGVWMSFALGSAVSAWCYIQFEYLGFLLPALIAAYCVHEARSPLRRLERMKRRCD